LTSEKEKLPLDLGWNRPKVMLEDTDLGKWMDMIINITASLGEEVKVPEKASPYDGKLKPRIPFHAGM
jgi:hypothetical protein